jgi:hypothetical protein
MPLLVFEIKNNDYSTYFNTISVLRRIEECFQDVRMLIKSTTLRMR